MTPKKMMEKTKRMALLQVVPTPVFTNSAISSTENPARKAPMMGRKTKQTAGRAFSVRIMYIMTRMIPNPIAASIETHSFFTWFF